jgi:DNA-binding NarL/FixJ family response regulator
VGVYHSALPRVFRSIVSGRGVWRGRRAPGIVRRIEAPNLSLVDPAPSDPPRPELIRILVAHGDNLSRAGLVALLDADPDMVVAGSAGDGKDAIAQLEEIGPDVLLIDLALPGVDALELTRRIVADPANSSVQVLILGDSEHGDEVLAALRSGAAGFLPRQADSGALIDSLRAVAAGGAALPPCLVRRLISELAARPDPGLPGPEQLDDLTPREREVMALVAGGLSNLEIAEHLVISRATAKTHVSRALYKLHARDRAQLVTLAYESGLVLPRQPVTLAAA